MSWIGSFSLHVAETVNNAHADGRGIRRAVAEVERIPLNTARNWIAEARKEGYLHDKENPS